MSCTIEWNWITSHNGTQRLVLGLAGSDGEVGRVLVVTKPEVSGRKRLAIAVRTGRRGWQPASRDCQRPVVSKQQIVTNENLRRVHHGVSAGDSLESSLGSCKGIGVNSSQEVWMKLLTVLLGSS